MIALDEKPPEGLPDRVMARIAMLTTIVEFGRLLGAAPLEFLNAARQGKVEDDDDDGSSGADH